MALPYVVAIFFICLDRFAKNYFLTTKENIALIKNYLSLTYAENYYIAFSLPLNPTFVKYLTLIILLVIIGIYVYTKKKEEPLLSFMIFVLILGASSNIIDRFKYGFVVDYINLKYFTVFNIADSLIFLSIIFLTVYLFKKDRELITKDWSRHQF